MKFVYPDQVRFDDLHKSFLEAFSDYKAPLQLTPEQFRTRIYEKLNIRNDLSVVAVDKHEKPVGFIFHTLNYYKNETAIYNGGTGVTPAYRHMKIATGMYEWIMPNLLKNRAKKIVLEVITDNSKAIEFYKNLGFVYAQTLRCFRQPFSLNIDIANVNIVRENNWPGNLDKKLSVYLPSFVDTLDQIRNNWHNEILLYTKKDERTTGYIFFQPKIGRISQIGFEDQLSGEALVGAASKLSDKKALTILNIPEDEDYMINFLNKMGFRNEIDQYEMELALR